MFTNSDFELTFCLANVLVVTDFASKHVYYILSGAITYMIFLIGSLGSCTIEIFTFVEYFGDRTVSVITDCLLLDFPYYVYSGCTGRQFRPDQFIF